MDSKKIIISGMLIAAVIGGIFYLDSKKFLAM